ncbi:hypothetical protein ABDI30_09830 [Paenibacillus cisolokensis]|uniref:hypothetical protein n=1 Tax=Paenibacillus cisolokensis TaxID=1658519 RepID=UPI003D2DA4D5
MNTRKWTIRAAMVLLASMVLLTSCGAPKGEEAGYLGDAVNASSGTTSGQAAAGHEPNTDSESQIQDASAAEVTTNEAAAADHVEEKAEAGEAASANDDAASEGDAEEANAASTAAEPTTASASAGTSAETANASEASDNGAQVTETRASEGAAEKSDVKSAADSSQTKQGSVSTAASSASSNAAKPADKAAAKQESSESKAKPADTAAASTKPANDAKSQPAASSSKYPQIGWNEFFDNEEQTTPSDRFWDLSDGRKTVQIKGFMGEVLSFNQNWFLLIPEPGAECPFDNGDETYWNKIMIVFVKDGSKLRYTSKPLKLTGRLDVGVKVDESGYKTMFRLYDATFEEI